MSLPRGAYWTAGLRRKVGFVGFCGYSSVFGSLSLGRARKVGFGKVPHETGETPEAHGVYRKMSDLSDFVVIAMFWALQVSVGPQMSDLAKYPMIGETLEAVEFVHGGTRKP